MQPNVMGWIYGHTHNTASCVIKNTLCVINARGYPNEYMPGFCNNAWIELNVPHDDCNTTYKNDELIASAIGIRSPYVSKPIDAEDVEFV